MVMVRGRFLHILAHSSDKKRILGAIELLRDSGKKTVLLERANRIITRDTDKNPIWRFMVKFLNFHFKSWIPFTGLGKIKVKRTKFNERYDTTHELREKIITLGSIDGDERDQLRIVFPRVGVGENVLLRGQIPIDITWSCTALTVLDPEGIFLENPDLSVWIDEQIGQAFVHFIGAFDLEEFQGESLSADKKNRLNRYFGEQTTIASTQLITRSSDSAGISNVFVIVTGAMAITAWKLDESQQILIDAKTDAVASISRLAAAENDAKATAAKIKAPGEAEAEAARLLGLQLKDNPALAEVLKMRAISGASTVVMPSQGQTTPPLVITPDQANKK